MKSQMIWTNRSCNQIDYSELLKVIICERLLEIVLIIQRASEFFKNHLEILWAHFRVSLVFWNGSFEIVQSENCLQNSGTLSLGLVSSQISLSLRCVTYVTIWRYLVDFVEITSLSSWRFNRFNGQFWSVVHNSLVGSWLFDRRGRTFNER